MLRLRRHDPLLEDVVHCYSYTCCNTLHRVCGTGGLKMFLYFRLMVRACNTQKATQPINHAPFSMLQSVFDRFASRREKSIEKRKMSSVEVEYREAPFT